VKKIQFQAPSRMVVYASEGGGGVAAEPLLFDVTGKGDLCFSGMYDSLGPSVLPAELTAMCLSVYLFVCLSCVTRSVRAVARAGAHASVGGARTRERVRAARR
jgi:hypothetical protein